ncbi:hypothetical protein ACFQS2_00590 [Brachybacterium sp. GCM10030267]|uniref:hypothetical protein n=1 Tax=unclassified Brachybacterium TaxID=2623841 RepID=UPI003614DDBF
MTENQYGHTDPEPTRPSQAEGEPDEDLMPAGDASDEPEPTEQDDGERFDPDPLRPSQAEGDSQG